MIVKTIKTNVHFNCLQFNKQTIDTFIFVYNRYILRTNIQFHDQIFETRSNAKMEIKGEFYLILNASTVNN